MLPLVLFFLFLNLCSISAQAPGTPDFQIPGPSTSQELDEPEEQPEEQPVEQPEEQATDRPASPPASTSADQSIGQPGSQRLSQSSSRPLNQSEPGLASPSNIHFPPLPPDYPRRLVIFRSPRHTVSFQQSMELGHDGSEGMDWCFHGNEGPELQVSNVYGQGVLFIQGFGPFGDAFTVAAKFNLNNPRPVRQAVTQARTIADDELGDVTFLTIIMPSIRSRRRSGFDNEDITRDWSNRLQENLRRALPYTEATPPVVYEYNPITEHTDAIVSVPIWSFRTTPNFRENPHSTRLMRLARHVTIDHGMLSPVRSNVQEMPPSPPSCRAASQQSQAGGGFLSCFLSPFRCITSQDDSDTSSD